MHKSKHSKVFDSPHPTIIILMVIVLIFGLIFAHLPTAKNEAPVIGPKNTLVGPHIIGCLEGKTVARVGTGTHDTYFYRLTSEGKTIPCQ